MIVVMVGRNEKICYTLKQTLNKCVCGNSQKILGLNALRFLEIHKVFLRNRAFLYRKIFLRFALADLFSACFERKSEN